jgi:PAS domain S-box-containing protein
MKGTLQDVTESAAAAEALRQSEERFRESFHRAAIAKGLVATDGRFLEVNAAFCRLTGYTERELRDMTPGDLTHPDDRKGDAELVNRLLSGEAQSYQREKRYLHESGAIVSVRVSVTLIHGRGDDRYFLGEVEDVTPQQRAESMLRDNQAHLQALVGSLDDIVFEFDGDGTYLDVWCRDESMLARPRNELLGCTVAEVIGEEAARPFVEAFRRVLAGGASETMEYTLDVQGGTRWFLARITPVRMASGAARSVCMLPRDITARKEAEQAQQQANRQLAAAIEELKQAQESTIRQERLRALGEMATGIAHDFNNALAAVLGFSELLLAEPGVLDDRARALSYVELIHGGASDAAGVVRRLREFYRPHEHADCAPVDLVRIAEAAISLTRPRWGSQPLASGRIVRVEPDLQQLPPVWGDEVALREMLTNLIFNAVDAIAGDGTVTVRTRGQDDRVVLEVADTGTGMSEMVRRRCLEPFFTTKGEAGSGLGLSMVYGVVSRHQGQLEIDSAPGKGTVVKVTLPTTVRRPNASSASSAPPPPRGLRGLVVDDEPLARDVVGKLLAIDDHRVQVAGSGAEALDLLATASFDVAILDRAMPGMTGDQLASTVAVRAPATGVVLFSGFGDFMLAAEEQPPGVDVVIGKPAGVQALREAVGRALALGRARGG